MIAVIVVGLALRLLFAFGYWTDKPLTHDEREYLTLADSLAAGEGFRYPPASDDDFTAPQRFGRAPGYPAFLALMGVPGESPQDVSSTPARGKIAQSLIGAAAVGLIGLLAARLGGGSAGVTAAWLAAAYPPLVWMCAYVLSETLYSFGALLCALLFGLAVDGSRPDLTTRRAILIAVAGGILAGLTILVRPVMLFFIGLAALWAVRRRAPYFTLAFVLGVALVISPWTIRNFNEHGRFVLVASEGGVTFWTGNHPLAIGEGDMAANPLIKEANNEFRRRHRTLSADELDAVYYREAVTHIARHPLWWLTLVARKFFYQWVPIGPSYLLHSTRYVAMSLLSYFLVLPCAIMGAVRLRARWPAGRALWLLACSALIASLLFFPQERFRIPVIDPTLVVLASVWLSGKWKVFQHLVPSAR